MSSSIQPTLPTSYSDPTEASIQRFGANPFDPDMIVQPNLRLNKTRNQLQHKIKRGSCKPSLDEDDFEKFRKVHEKLRKFKGKQLWADLESQKGTAESKTIQDELTRYCKKSGLSIIACFTLPDYIRLVEKRPDWVTVYGAERESFARHLLTLSTAPDSGAMEEDTAPDEPFMPDYHDSHISRCDDLKRKGTCTVSEPGDNDDREDNAKSIGIIDGRSRTWDLDWEYQSQKTRNEG
jgi:hypothetical protein